MLKGVTPCQTLRKVCICQITARRRKWQGKQKQERTQRTYENSEVFFRASDSDIFIPSSLRRLARVNFEKKKKKKTSIESHPLFPLMPRYRPGHIMSMIQMLVKKNQINGNDKRFLIPSLE